MISLFNDFRKTVSLQDVAQSWVLLPPASEAAAVELSYVPGEGQHRSHLKRELSTLTEMPYSDRVAPDRFTRGSALLCSIAFTALRQLPRA